MIFLLAAKKGEPNSETTSVKPNNLLKIFYAHHEMSCEFISVCKYDGSKNGYLVDVKTMLLMTTWRTTFRAV